MTSYPPTPSFAMPNYGLPAPAAGSSPLSRPINPDGSNMMSSSVADPSAMMSSGQFLPQGAAPNGSQMQQISPYAMYGYFQAGNLPAPPYPPMSIPVTGSSMPYANGIFPPVPLPQAFPQGTFQALAPMLPNQASVPNSNLVEDPPAAMALGKDLEEGELSDREMDREVQQQEAANTRSASVQPADVNTSVEGRTYSYSEYNDASLRSRGASRSPRPSYEPQDATLDKDMDRAQYRSSDHWSPRHNGHPRERQSVSRSDAVRNWQPSSRKRSYDQYIPSHYDRDYDRAYDSQRRRPSSPRNSRVTDQQPRIKPANPVNEARPQDHNSQIKSNDQMNTQPQNRPSTETDHREAAKKAILHLLPLQIRYQHLVDEGVDEGVLRSLYEELNLKHLIPNPSSKTRDIVATSKMPQAANNQTQSAKHPANVTLKTKTGDTNSPQPSAELAKPKASAPDVARSEAVRNVAPVASLPPKPPAVLTSTAETSTPQTIAKPIVRLPPSRSSTFKSLTSASNLSSRGAELGQGKVERKDLIAQKLAAQSGKSAPQTSPATNLNGTKTTTSIVSQSPITQAKPAVPEPIRVLLPPTKQTETVPIQSLPEEAEDIKKRRQTEIVRQRLANLQNSGAGTRESINTVKPGTQTDASRGDLHQPTVTVPPIVSTSISAPISSTIPSVIVPAVPNIPGLFMTPVPASDAAAPEPRRSSLPSFASDVALVNRRKRPVAADFDNEPLSGGQIKRPFGQNRTNSQLVIDVSEDESTAADNSDDDMDMAYENMSVNRVALPDSRSIRDMPPLSDTAGSRKSFGKSIGTGTSSVSRTPPVTNNEKTSTQENLKAKERAIQEMQKKIAELQERKAKQSASRPDTPGTPGRGAGGGTGNAGPRNPSETRAATVRDLDRLIDDTQTKVREDEIELAAAKAAEVKATSSKLEETRKEALRLRRVELQLKLKESAAGMEQDLKKLEEYRRAQEKQEAALKEALEAKAKLQRELEGLDSIFTESASKVVAEDESTSLAKEDNFYGAQGITNGTEEVAQNLNPVPSVQSPDSEVLSNVAAQSIPGLTTLEKHDPSVATPLSPIVETVLRDRPASSHEQSPIARIDEFAHAPVVKVVSPSADANQPTPATTNSQSEVSRENSTLSETPMVDSPQIMQLENQRPVEKAAPTEISESYKEEGELSSADESDQDSDSYEPPEATPPALEPQLEPVLELQPQPMSRPNLQPEMESIPEPAPAPDPEPSQLPSDVEEKPDGAMLDSPPFSPAPVDETPPFSPVSADLRVSAAEVEALAPVTANPDSSQNHQAIRIPETVELPIPKTPISIERSREGQYTAYESPLKQFRSYRYHPKFAELVAGGLRSLTYSHKIDAQTPVCQFEASGGTCNDDSCTGQHFRDMALSDDHILVQIGSINEGNTKEEKEEYNAGLRIKLKELRNRQVKDFSTVASEIIRYRAEFLKDPSRVLVLPPERS